MQAASFAVLLGVAVPLKYLAGYAGAVTVVGVLHGTSWLLYMWVVLAMVSLKMWNTLETLRLVGSTLIPLGGFSTARWIRRIDKK